MTEQVSGLAQGRVLARELELALEQGSARVPVSAQAQARGLEQVLEPGQVWVPAQVRALALGPVQEKVPVPVPE